MTWLILIAALSAPSWVQELTFQSPGSAPLSLLEESGPGDFMLVAAQKQARFRAAQAGPITIEIASIMQRRGKAGQTAAGAVTIFVGEEKHFLRLSNDSTEWRMHKRPRWLVGAVTSITILPEAGQRVRVVPNTLARFGIAVRLTAPAAEAQAEPLPPEPPPIPPPVPPPAEESPSMQVAAALPEDDAELDLGDDIELISTPFAAPAHPVSSGFTIVAPVPPVHAMAGPKGGQDFYHVNRQDGLRLDAVGPGTLVFDFHAHRSAAQPESLEAVVVGVLVNDVLVQTIALDQAQSPNLTLPPNFAATPSKLATLRLPIAGGAHSLYLSLSDTAVLGASVRVSFEGFREGDEPLLFTADARQDLRATEPEPDVKGDASFAVLAGLWLPNALPTAGITAQLEGDLGIPVVGSRLSVGIAVAVAAAENPVNIALPTTGELAPATLGLLTAPLILDIRARPPLPHPFRLSIGVGGGVTLGWSRLQGLGLDQQSAMLIAPTLAAHLSLGVALGPGSLSVRGQFQSTAQVTGGPLRHFDLGGTSVFLGYQVGGGS